MDLIKNLKQEELNNIFGGDYKLVFIDGEWTYIEIGTYKG
jgi:hypothetical protein